MTTAYLVQHGEKEQKPGDPGLTQAGRRQATRAGQWLRDQGVTALYSPLCQSGGMSLVRGHTDPDRTVQEGARL